MPARTARVSEPGLAAALDRPPSGRRTTAWAEVYSQARLPRGAPVPWHDTGALADFGRRLAGLTCRPRPWWT